MLNADFHSTRKDDVIAQSEWRMNLRSFMMHLGVGELALNSHTC